MRFVALKHMSPETKMKNHSFSSTWTGSQAYHKTRHARREEIKRAKKKMWVHHVGNGECRRKLRHPKRSFDWQESLSVLNQCSRHNGQQGRSSGAGVVVSAFSSEWKRPFLTKDHTFASKYIRIRAFHKAISRSCILLRFETGRQIW